MRIAYSSPLLTTLSAVMFTAFPLAPAEAANVAPVEAAVLAILEPSGYRPGDLLKRSQVRAVLAELIAKGYEIPHANAILGRSVLDDSFLAKQLETAGGKRFLRKIGQISGGYRRLERLAALPQGKQLVHQLQRDPGGDKLIEYLATTASGRRLGSMTANGPHGVNLNEPTGRIYTAADLAQAIEQAMRAEATPTTATGVKSLSPQTINRGLSHPAIFVLRLASRCLDT